MTFFTLAFNILVFSCFPFWMNDTQEKDIASADSTKICTSTNIPGQRFLKLLLAQTLPSSMGGKAAEAWLLAGF